MINLLTQAYVLILFFLVSCNISNRATNIGRDEKRDANYFSGNIIKSDFEILRDNHVQKNMINDECKNERLDKFLNQIKILRSCKQSSDCTFYKCGNGVNKKHLVDIQKVIENFNKTCFPKDYMSDVKEKCIGSEYLVPFCSDKKLCEVYIKR